MPIPIHPGCEKLLVSDFDGTMTSSDFFERALALLADEPMPDYWGDYVAGRRTHFDALRGIYSHIRGGEEEVMEIARGAGLDPRLADAVRRLREGGWDVVIVSAGCTWYIERLLAEAGVRLHVISNPGEVRPGKGLVMRRPAGSPFYSEEVGVDKAGVVRWALEHVATVAFAGDGRPDEACARMVPPERRFARRWLAEAFVADGTPFRRFDRWSEIADALLAEAGR